MKRRTTFGLFAVLLLAGSPAYSAVIYDWSGECDLGCTGTATASLTLVDSYVPGTNLVSSDFVSFSYASSSGTVDIPGDADFNGFAPGSALPAASGSATLLVIDFTGSGPTLFCAPFGQSPCSNVGGWNMVFATLGIGDTGRNPSSWVIPDTAVPEPSTAILLGTVLAGVLLRRRRR